VAGAESIPARGAAGRQPSRLRHSRRDGDVATAFGAHRGDQPVLMRSSRSRANAYRPRR
jgi:hypothetical protein